MARDRSLPPTLKRLGQHFLTDHAILERIADSLALTKDDTVVEIGPGRGALTDLLADRAGRVVAIEIDRALAGVLRQRYRDRPQVEIVERDVLETDLGEVAGPDFVLAGNVPYYITTPILFHALAPPRPRRAVYLVQREVAERVVAAPGSREYGALSVNVQALAVPELLFAVPAGAFSPPPKVESAVIAIVPRESPAVPREREAALRTFVVASFALRRKQLRRVVRTVASFGVEQADRALAAAALDPEARPETLSAEQFVALLAAVDVERGRKEPG